MISSLKSSVEFYVEFLKHFHSTKNENEDNLSLLKYLIDFGNTTVYQWKTGGHAPVQIERPALNYQLTLRNQDEETNLDLDLDENNDLDMNATIEGIEIKQTSDQTENLDLDLVRTHVHCYFFHNFVKFEGKWNRLVVYRHRTRITRSRPLIEWKQSQFDSRCIERSSSQWINTSKFVSIISKDFLSLPMFFS